MNKKVEENNDDNYMLRSVLVRSKTEIKEELENCTDFIKTENKKAEEAMAGLLSFYLDANRNLNYAGKFCPCTG